MKNVQIFCVGVFLFYSVQITNGHFYHKIRMYNKFDLLVKIERIWQILVWFFLTTTIWRDFYVTIFSLLSISHQQFHVKCQNVTTKFQCIQRIFLRTARQLSSRVPPTRYKIDGALASKRKPLNILFFFKIKFIAWSSAETGALTQNGNRQAQAKMFCLERTVALSSLQGAFFWRENSNVLKMHRIAL